MKRSEWLGGFLGAAGAAVREMTREFARRHPKKIIGAAVLALTLGTFYLTCLNYLELNEVGLTWNWVRGRIELQGRAGWHASPPWVMVTPLETAPQRVCITSAAHAAFNCKLVQFNPVGYEEFARVEGFRYYWWSNRLSFNWGYREEYRGWPDILRGYAFSAKQYPFLRVLRD